MNIFEMDVLLYLLKEKYHNQRIIAESTGYSLGVINKSLNNLKNNGYIDKQMKLMDKSKKEIEINRPKNAIILAAGFGMRMIPINLETPKALIEIKGETLIERLIKQLHEVDITNITIVVGFMKERFEYLIDEYGVKLVFNDQYSEKNNLHSLACVADEIFNTYIIPCDIWCVNNPFRKNELYSWYMVSERQEYDSNVRVNRKMELISVPRNVNGNKMIGIAYLTGESVNYVKTFMKKNRYNIIYDNAFWEEALYIKNKMVLYARMVNDTETIEINTYEQLREFDEDSNNLHSDAIMLISEVLNVKTSEIKNINVLKKGMTNRSFIFNCKDKKYIMRIPGEGTSFLINRKGESEVYNLIMGKEICDNVIYINPENGYKITEYIENSRVCDSNKRSDVIAAMNKLKEFHSMKIEVNEYFDIFKNIEFYENLWNGKKSIFKDYLETKENVLSLQNYINEHVGEKCLTHIDAIPDNFIFDENENIRLIDWEYAGMQDPHVDIAMFCIYSMYNKEQIDDLIDIYFDNQCDRAIRLKIYCYIAACGLLWSNWCEYKRSLGVEFGEYSLRQYHYAKEYYKIFKEELGES